jgi:hypothetical protein
LNAAKKAWPHNYARRGWAWLFYILLAAFAIGANPFAKQTVGPFDLLVAQDGWTSPVNTSQVHHAERSDVLDFFLPRWIWARQVIRSGHFPHWDPLPAGGDNVFLNPVYGELTPAFAIFTATPDPALGYYLAVLFNLSMAGLGVHLWLRRRLGLAATVMGSITFMLCGFNAAWLFWPQVLTIIWIGWALWALDGWWKEKSPGHYLVLITSLALIILGGFPFVGILCFAAVGLYASCLAILERPSSRLAGLFGTIAAMLLALGLCAVPAAAMIDWIGHFDLGYRQGGSGLHLPHDALLLLPHFAKRAPHVESTIYVGLAGVGLAFSGCVVMLRRWKTLGAFELYTLLLTAAAACLVFEIIPARYLAWVPALNRNLWTRAAILLDLALAIAAAYALDLAFEKLKALKTRRLAVLVAMAVIGLQYADATSLFRRFNGPASSLDFYPDTPLIREIKAHIRPFQSVIADNHYLVSGTLGAYGLPEWFAHGFKRAALKAALGQLSDNPFVTPTASVLDANDLNLESPLMSAMGVRYVLCDCDSSYDSQTPLFESPPMRTPGIALPRQPPSHWVQSFLLAQPAGLHAIRLNMATYGKSGLPGHVTLTLYPGNDSRPIAASTLAAAQILDSRMAIFAFEHPLALQAGSYRFTVQYDSPRGAPMTVWSKPLKAANCTLTVDGALVAGCMDFQLQVLRTTPSRFRPIAAADGLRLLENTQVPAGPYFLGSLSTYPDRYSADQVTVADISSTGFTLQYHGQGTGYLVVPMQWSRDWQASDQGGNVPAVPYLGLLPAFAVHGPAMLRFQYHSAAWSFTWISIVALLAAFGLAFFFRYTRPLRQRHWMLEQV